MAILTALQLHSPIHNKDRCTVLFDAFLTAICLKVVFLLTLTSRIIGVLVPIFCLWMLSPLQVASNRYSPRLNVNTPTNSTVTEMIRPSLFGHKDICYISFIGHSNISSYPYLWHLCNIQRWFICLYTYNPDIHICYESITVILAKCC